MFQITGPVPTSIKIMAYTSLKSISARNGHFFVCWTFITSSRICRASFSVQTYRITTIFRDVNSLFRNKPGLNIIWLMYASCFRGILLGSRGHCRDVTIICIVTNCEVTEMVVLNVPYKLKKHESLNCTVPLPVRSLQKCFSHGLFLSKYQSSKRYRSLISYTYYVIYIYRY